MKTQWPLLALMLALTASLTALAPGGRLPDLPEIDLPAPLRPDDNRVAITGPPDSYLVFGIMPPEISAVTYDAWIFGTRFAVLNTLDATPSARPPRERPASLRQLGEITAVNFVSMRDNYFVPGIFKAAPMGARWSDTTLDAWLDDGVDTYAPLVGGFRNKSRGERRVEGHAVRFVEVSYFSQKDNLEMEAVFATWGSTQSGNAYLLFAMTAPEFTPDDALSLVLAEIANLGDYIDIEQGSGSPLKGLNVTSTGNSADGKTVEVDFDD